MASISLAFLMLAQSAAIDTLSGTGGWAGCGLVGLVLSWLLLVHLPAKDKQVKDTFDANVTQVKGLVDSFGITLKEQRTEFLSSLKDQQTTHLASLDKTETRLQRGMDGICARLERIEDHIASAGFADRTREQNEVLSQALERKKSGT